MSSSFHRRPEASWLPTMRSRSVAQVMCASPRMQWGIQVKPVVAAAAHPGSGCRCYGYHAGCCRKGPRRQRITTAWGIGSCWVDGKAVATQRDGELRPITAKGVMMHNVSRDAAVYLICELCWNIYSGSRVWVSTDVFQLKLKCRLSKQGNKNVRVSYCTVSWLMRVLCHPGHSKCYKVGRWTGTVYCNLKKQERMARNPEQLEMSQHPHPHLTHTHTHTHTMTYL